MMNKMMLASEILEIGDQFHNIFQTTFSLNQCGRLAQIQMITVTQIAEQESWFWSHLNDFLIIFKLKVIL